MPRRNLIIFFLFILAAAGVVASQFVFRWSRGTLLNPTDPLNITLLYSSELSPWLEPAAADFNNDRQKVGDRAVHVDIEASDDGEAMRSIVAGSRTPTAWLPASSVWVNLLNNQWRSSHQADLLLRSGEYGARPLALTPLVFVMPEERAGVFAKNGRTVDWKDIQAAVTNPGGWGALGGDDLWGRVKFSQADPSRSNAGLLAAALAAYSYFNKTTGLTADDVDDPGYRTWVQGLVDGFIDSAPPTAQQQMEDMLRYGQSRYDVVSVYESLVVQQIKNAQGRLGTGLKVYYPRLNLWSDYPFSILMSDASTADQKDAALLFMKYLYSPPLQQKALVAGFRPSNPDVPLITNDASNPFFKYRDAGFDVKIPRTLIADTPGGDVLTRLMTLYQR